MKRHTKKLEISIGPLKYCIDNPNDAVGATQKLGEVEDWEEIIGMPLVALARLKYSDIENLYIIADNKIIKCEIIDIDGYALILLGENDDSYVFGFDSYLKRWFFTKEAEKFIKINK